MNSLSGVARVLLIADDRETGAQYGEALATGGYAVTQADSFVETLGNPGPHPDVIVLCDLALFAYPAQRAQVLRVTAEMTPAALVAEVHRRVALRAALYATRSLAA
jgi:DNA-binding response OmpR family regulator